MKKSELSKTILVGNSNIKVTYEGVLQDGDCNEYKYFYISLDETVTPKDSFSIPIGTQMSWGNANTPNDFEDFLLDCACVIVECRVKLHKHILSNYCCPSINSYINKNFDWCTQKDVIEWLKNDCENTLKSASSKGFSVTNDN